MKKNTSSHEDKYIIDKAMPHFSWPVIDDEIEKAVSKQLHESISIYDNGGIFREFEKNFSELSGLKYNLLFNSGTSALHASYFAINLPPGSELISSVYTFHASTSPAVSLGLKVRFCDTDEWGNMSFDSLEHHASSDTKAVVVTHMWGNPVRDIDKIADYCKRKGIYLIEDCSHAHGAKIYGKRVGTFGDIAAWSIQGQKNISGGEGGVFGTNDEQFFHRALLFGHYNKRPKNEIPSSSDLYRYYLTGYGLKLRAHPLAVTIANSILLRYSSFLKQKAIYAAKITSELEKYDFITPPPSDGENSWYAYAFRLNVDKKTGINREHYVEKLHSLGLLEADIPGSTGLINNLPLFIDPGGLRNDGVRKQVRISSEVSFPNADRFSSELVKLPVWAFESDSELVDRYIEGLAAVSKQVQRKLIQ